jgi:3-hydroxyacyl-[acyl-carrier-protein] dehydratase
MESESEHLSVAADHPALPGHFPGRPIVPGVVILDLLVEEWRRRRPDAPVRGLRKMKFVAMLAPDQEFSVGWGEIRDGKVTFTVESGGKSLAAGQFVLA